MKKMRIDNDYDPTCTELEKAICLMEDERYDISNISQRTDLEESILLKYRENPERLELANYRTILSISICCDALYIEYLIPGMSYVFGEEFKKGEFITLSLLDEIRRLVENTTKEAALVALIESLKEIVARDPVIFAEVFNAMTKTSD